MKSFAVLALASSGITLVTAQIYPTIDPESIDINTRDIWCVQQQATCDNLCQNAYQADAEFNDCNPEDLQFECICPGGFRPNMTEYSMTIPYSLCQESKQQCSNNCNNDAQCSTDCFKGKQCGATNPTRVNITTTESTATATGTQTGYPNHPDSTTDAAPTDNVFNNSNFASSLTELASFYGFGAIFVGIVVGFFEIM